MSAVGGSSEPLRGPAPDEPADRAPAAGPSNRGRPARAPVRPVVLALVLALLVAVLWGGYGHHWPWTGINGHTATLWDWLHLLLLPVAVGVLPLWLSRRTRLARAHKAVGLGVLAAFGLVVLAGYVVPWAWTGFVGNRLWDWLELLLLPLAVALAPLYRELREVWSARHTTIALLGLGLFLIAVVGGYAGRWSWTGFEGNTLWDWLHLLLLPLLLPTMVVPAIMPMATAGTATAGEAEAPRATRPPPANTGPRLTSPPPPDRRPGEQERPEPASPVQTAARPPAGGRR